MQQAEDVQLQKPVQDRRDEAAIPAPYRALWLATAGCPAGRLGTRHPVIGTLAYIFGESSAGEIKHGNYHLLRDLLKQYILGHGQA